MKSRHSVAIAFATLLSVMPVSNAFSALPDGANSLNETYQDWRVACVSDGETDRCSMLQNQVSKDSGQRVMSVELTAPNANGLQGIVLMPFGLALAKGISISIDDAPADATFGFSTCVPQGCVVPVQFNADMIGKLKNGGTLKISGTVLDSGEAITISSSLNGFTAAYNRLNALR